MAYQTARNVRVAYKAESTFNTLAGASGATQFRINSGGLSLTKGTIDSGEIRPDGLITRGRHGQRAVAGSYEGDLSLGTFDGLFAGVFRNAWEASLPITESTASLASITTTTSTIVAGGGSWITAGLRVGDVIRLTNHATAGNNSKNLRITALTATTITVAETLVLNATPDTAFTITRPKKLLQGTTPTSFTVEETEQDIDGSEVFTGVRVGSMTVNLNPNAMATVSFGMVGANMQTMTGAQSPYFTSPTNTTRIGMTAVEASLLVGGVAVADLTALTLGIDLAAAGVDVVGASITPEVFTNRAAMSGSITGLRQDLARVTSFLNEDQLSLPVLLTENETEPKDFISLYVPNLTFSSATKSELGADGPRTQECALLIGADDRGAAAGYDQTALKIQTSAA